LGSSQAKRPIRLPPSGRPTRPAPIESSPEGVLDKSLEHAEANLNAGKPQVAQIIGAINVLDINGVVVAPAYWPSLIEPEPIAAVLEAVIPADHLWTDHVERVATAEMGTVASVRNATIMVAVVATVVSNGLSLLPSGLPRLLCALWLLALCLLCALWLLALRLLCALRLLALRLLCALRLLALRLLCALLRLRFLCALLRLRLLCTLLRLRFLCALLRLRLVLRRLGFSSASALFLLAFLC